MKNMEISIRKTLAPKVKPNENNLIFGHSFTDHMFIMDYTEGQGWHDGCIVPYGPLTLDPSTMVFHYAQETFEGLKAYKTATGDIQLFRAKDNIARLNQSNERLCIPTLNEEDVMQAITSLVKIDEAWIPKA